MLYSLGVHCSKCHTKVDMTKPSPDDAQYQWDLAPLLSGDDDPAAEADQAAVKAAAQAFAGKWRHRDDYLRDVSELRSALDDYEAWQRGGGADGRAGVYFWLREQQNQANPIVQAKLQRLIDVRNTAWHQVRFFELKLGKITPEQQARFLDAPELAGYHHFLERLFVTARHQLSEAEERILDLKADTSYDKWVKLTSKAVSAQQRIVTLPDGTQAPQTLESLLTLISDPQPAVRHEAAAALNDIFAEMRDYGESELNAILADKKVNDELRGFTRPDASRHLSDDIDSEIVDALLGAVTARNGLAHRFYRLKADLFGLPQLRYHERNLEYGRLDQEYTWDEAVRLVDGVYSELNPKFGEIFRRFLQHHQIDVFPRSHKRGGAFCAHFSKEQPTYIMLNYTNKLKDVTTLAHELGHGLNDEFMKVQNALNFGTPLSTAEVSSQYLEDFVLDRLSAEADDELRLAINLSRLNDAVSSIFRQVACYRFEQSLHAAFRDRGYLTAGDIGELFQAAMAAYMGPAVEQSPGSQNWWIYWGHIRRYFYVYSYASGLLIAKCMQAATRRDRAFLAQVEAFLSAGRSASPRQVFATMGIDITDAAFWNQGLDEIDHLLTETEHLARRLGKLR